MKIIETAIVYIVATLVAVVIVWFAVFFLIQIVRALYKAVKYFTK